MWVCPRELAFCPSGGQEGGAQGSSRWADWRSSCCKTSLQRHNPEAAGAEQPTGFWAAADLLSPLRLGQAVPAAPASVLLHRASRGRLAPAESCQARNPVRLLAQMAWRLPLFPRPCYIWTTAMMLSAATTIPCHTQVRCSWPASWLCWLGRGQREAPGGSKDQRLCGERLGKGAGMGQTRPVSSESTGHHAAKRAHLVGRQGQP